MKTLARSSLKYVVFFLVIASFSAASASITAVEFVKVYSEGFMVAIYEAVEKGRMDGNCYVFKIRKRGRTLTVRVCGTFVVEEAR